MMLKLPSYLTGFASKSDGSASLRFSTQELPAEAFVELQKNLNAYGYLIFNAVDMPDEDVPDDLPDDNSKKPSQRLRAVLFIYWKQQNVGGDFNAWYRAQMEKLIEHYKEKLT